MLHPLHSTGPGASVPLTIVIVICAQVAQFVKLSPVGQKVHSFVPNTLYIPTVQDVQLVAVPTQLLHGGAHGWHSWVEFTNSIAEQPCFVS